MKAAVIYDGNYGSTKEYAEWIAAESGIPAFHVRKNKSICLADYDTVVIGSSVSAGRLIIGKWMKRNWKELGRKRVILFSVSGTPPQSTEVLKKILSASLTGEIIAHVSYHPMRGRMIFEKLPMHIRFLMSAVSLFIKDKNVRKGMTQSYDAVCRKNIEPILRDLRGEEHSIINNSCQPEVNPSMMMN